MHLVNLLFFKINFNKKLDLYSFTYNKEIFFDFTEKNNQQAEKRKQPEKRVKKRTTAGKKGVQNDLSIPLSDVMSACNYKQVSEKKNFILKTFIKDERVFSFKEFGRIDQFIAVYYTGRRSSKIFFGQVIDIDEVDDTGVVQFYKKKENTDDDGTSDKWFQQDDKDRNTVLSPFVYAWDISVEISVKKTKSEGQIVKIVNDFDIFEKAKEDLEAWLAQQ